MGGEAGIEGGVPPTIDQKSVPPNPPKELSKELSKDKSIKSKEQKKKEKEQRAFDNKVAIKARQLWEEDGCPEDKGLYFDYIKRAEKIITESEEAKRKEDNARRREANARRRKEREDRKKREEPAPRPDIPNAPPDQGGEETSSTEEIARSEAITQEPTVEQTPSEQQKELASEDLYLKGIRDELNKLDEKGEDKNDAIGIQPAPKLQDIIDATMPKQVIPTTEETKRPVDDEGLFKKVIESTAKSLGINPEDVSPALIDRLRRNFLALQAGRRGMEALRRGGAFFDEAQTD